MWEIILGGIIALAGSWGAIWFQSRNSRKIRMEEIKAERKVTANAQAYSRIKQIQSVFLQKTSQDTLEIIAENEEWFFNNRLFLPGKFPDKWLTIRRDLFKLARAGNTVTPAKKTETENQITQFIADAIDEIYTDMDLERIKVD